MDRELANVKNIGCGGHSCREKGRIEEEEEEEEKKKVEAAEKKSESY